MALYGIENCRVLYCVVVAGRLVAMDSTEFGAGRRLVRLPTTEGNALTRSNAEACDVTERFVCWPQGCPYGYLTDPPSSRNAGLWRASPREECHCTPRQIRQYLGRISGPLLDAPSPTPLRPCPEWRDWTPRCRGSWGELEGKLRAKLDAKLNAKLIGK